MKLDYKFIKEILMTMEEYEHHEIQCSILSKNLKIASETNIKDKCKKEKFIGHIKILGDNNFIESSASNYGIKRCANGYMIGNPLYRMTARGYEFLDVLKNDTVLNKIKNYTLSTAYNIGTQCLTSEIISQIKNAIS
ncbi:MAG: DUF2513 domain-containing protein [Muribaculaceae bacterium]|nr:DUF2513 domain-containing protein [Muribaculaceae bacterium]